MIDEDDVATGVEGRTALVIATTVQAVLVALPVAPRAAVIAAVGVVPLERRTAPLVSDPRQSKRAHREARAHPLQPRSTHRARIPDNAMRITGGAFRSRPLVAPRGNATRPTSDRVREALFSILGSLDAVASGQVLDLYAGTGALGLEALSRGAARATFVEPARAALGALRANVDALGVADRVRVLAVPVARAVELLAGEVFELVLADPPYADVAEAARALERLAEARILGPGGLVVLEHSAKERPIPAGFAPAGTRRYGDTALSLFRAGGP